MKTKLYSVGTSCTTIRENKLSEKPTDEEFWKAVENNIALESWDGMYFTSLDQAQKYAEARARIECPTHRINSPYPGWEVWSIIIFESETDEEPVPMEEYDPNQGREGGVTVDEINYFEHLSHLIVH